MGHFQVRKLWMDSFNESYTLVAKFIGDEWGWWLGFHGIRGLMAQMSDISSGYDGGINGELMDINCRGLQPTDLRWYNLVQLTSRPPLWSVAKSLVQPASGNCLANDLVRTRNSSENSFAVHPYIGVLIFIFKYLLGYWMACCHIWMLGKLLGWVVFHGFST
jgi:hypothetical protein